MKKIWALSIFVVSLFSLAIMPVAAQQQQPANQDIITDIRVQGNVRIEAATVASYLTVTVGDKFDQANLDASLKRLFSTGLFNDVNLYRQGNILIIQVVESPIINRIIFEGNKKLDNEDLSKEITIKPRDIFTRAKVRAEVARILELYRKKGRFAAIVEPKVVQQDQNRVDVVFEIQEGPKTKVSKINFMGNHKFSDGDLHDVLQMKESKWWKIFSSGDMFDPDLLMYDQQQLRTFYLNEGYADFRIISAVAELTPDRKNFIVNYTVDEGEIYTFGKMKVESDIRNVKAEYFQIFLRAREGQTYSQEAVEKSQEALTDIAGAQGYAFVDIRPQASQNREKRTIDYTFRILEAPRVYVERINISGNIRTLDKVIRREVRLQEGDAFNSMAIKRSEQRLNSLGFFREGSVDIQYNQGAKADRTVIDITVEEQSTGDLNFGVGFSSIENFMFNFSINERNFMGKGQNLGLTTNFSGYSQSANLSFSDPYLFDRNISGGANVFVNKVNGEKYGSSFNSESLGFTVRAGAAISEYWTIQANYTLRLDEISLTENYLNQALSLGVFDYYTRQFTYYTDETLEANGILERKDWDYETKRAYVYGDSFNDPQYAGSFGRFNQSIIGYTIGTNTLNNYMRPTAGRSFYFSQNIAGLGGDVKYLRSNLSFENYWTPIEGWTLRNSLQLGHIKGLGQNVRLSDSFYLGGPELRGFDFNGVGPRRLTNRLSETTVTTGDLLRLTDPRYFGRALGGNKKYVNRTEVFFPLGDAALEMGINASAFLDVGSLWGTDIDLPKCKFGQKEYDHFISVYEKRLEEGRNVPTFNFETDCIVGNSWKPRAAVGIGFSWQSPFGPFRIDLTKDLRSQFGDQPKALQFNIGTSF